MRKVHKQDGFIIIEDEDKIQISWMVGVFGKEVSYAISRENMQKALKSKEDAYEVMVFAETFLNCYVRYLVIRICLIRRKWNPC